VLCALLTGCVDTTGSALVTFHAVASGPADAAAGVLETDNGFGFHVTITQATIHMGALYLNRTVPTPGAQDTACVLAGIYTAEVRGGRDIDALSPEPQAFPVAGDGTADVSAVAEIWLSGGDVNAAIDDTVVVRVAGVAERDGTTYPFAGQVTINANRTIPATDPALPGAHPICKQRIITPIRVDLTPTEGGTLRVVVDPRPWFANIDFAEVAPDPAAPGSYVFPDTNDDQQSKNLFNGVRAASGGAYAFTWEPAAP
jgi:hypothetical protein